MGISGHQEFFFFLAIWGAGYFFPFFPISFLLHLCCMQLLSSEKRLQEFFFQNHPPHPSRVKWSAPKQGTGLIWEEKIGGKLSPARFLPLLNKVASARRGTSSNATPLVLNDNNNNNNDNNNKEYNNNTRNM